MSGASLVSRLGRRDLIQSPWGPRITAVWGEEIPWELPQTDYVTLMTADHYELFTVPFPTPADLAGILPIPGLSPVRATAPASGPPRRCWQRCAHTVELRKWGQETSAVVAAPL